MNKKWYSILDSVSFSISLLLIGSIMIGVGNITTSNAVLSQILSATAYVGVQIKKLFPFILVINYLGKNYSDITPVITGIICYVLLNITSMFTINGLYDSSYYTDILGLNYNGLKPLNFGILASIVICLIVDVCYSLSRKRYNYGILRFINNDVFFFLTAIITTVLAGLGMCVASKKVVSLFMKLYQFIASYNSNPAVLFIYGVVDKVLEMLGTDEITKSQFLFGPLGGSYAINATTTIYGDVNIWTTQIMSGTVEKAVGKFVTPSYIINIFAIPSLIIGYYLNVNDKLDKKKYLGLVIVAIVASLITSNSLPMEYLLFFTAPLLLVVHLLLCGSMYMVLSIMSLYLGYSYTGNIASMSMGNIINFISYFNNVDFHSTVVSLITIGVIYFVLYQLIVYVFYHFLSLDFLDGEVKKLEIRKIILALGGLDNIEKVTSTTIAITVVVKNKSKINVDQLIANRAFRVKERYYGYVISFGPSSSSVCRAINKELKNYEDCLKFSLK